MRADRDLQRAQDAARDAHLAALESAEPSALPHAFFAWSGAAALVLRGDLGTVPGAVPRSVGSLVAEAFPRTMVLLVLALGLAAIFGVIGGVLAVDRRTGAVSPAASMLGLVGFAMPAFMLGILGVRIAISASRMSGGWLPTLPAIGYGLDKHLILPVIALAIRPSAEVARVLSELLGEELRSDYVRTALAKGRTLAGALVRHALPNVAGAVAIALGGSLLTLLSSAIVVESLFEWPGLGRQLALALAPRTDGRPSGSVFLHPETVATLLVIMAALHLGVILAADWIAARLDPRMRRERPDTESSVNSVGGP